MDEVDPALVAAWLALVVDLCADSDQPQGPMALRAVARPLAGETREQAPPPLAAARDGDGLGVGHPPAGVAAALRVDIDQAEQEIERPLPLAAERLQQVVGALAEDAGDPALVREHLGVETAVAALLPQPGERVLDQRQAARLVSGLGHHLPPPRR